MRMESSTTELKLSCDAKTGRFIAAYFKIREGKSVKTVEISEGAAFADYDADGQLLGIETIGSCDISAPNRLFTQEPIREFIEERGIGSAILI